MASGLVTVKSKTQNRIEGWLMLTLPIGLSLACCYAFGRPCWFASVLAPFALWGTPAVGSMIASAFGGELVTPEERYRRMIARASDRSAMRPFATAFVLYALFFLAVFIPMVPKGYESDLYVILGPVSLAGGLVMAVIVSMAIRRSARIYADPVASNLPALDPVSFLRQSLPLFYLCFLGGTLAGFCAGLLMPEPASLLALMAGCWGGMLGYQGLKLRRAASDRPPLLWHQFTFGQAVLFAFLQYSIPFALFFALLVPLDRDRAEKLTWLVMCVFALGGAAFGLALGVFFWGLNRISGIRLPKRS